MSVYLKCKENTKIESIKVTSGKSGWTDISRGADRFSPAGG